MVTATRAPSGPKPRFLVGHLLDVNRDQLGFLTHCARTYGDAVTLQFGLRKVLVLNHPDLIEEALVTKQRNFVKGYFYRILGPLLGNGLLTSEGDFWLRQRRLAQPAFHRERISAYAQTMLDYTADLLASWRDGEVRDVHEDMMRLTLRIVGKTLFGTDVESEAPEVGAALSSALAELNNQMTGPEFLLPMRVPTPSRRRLRDAVRRIDPVIYRLIAERRADPTERGDLLSVLLHAQDEDGSRMTDQQLHDEAMTIVLAGHETTALALSWAWYLLSEHRETRERLATELDQVLVDRAPTLSDVPKLRFAEAVILESMRLYPPIFGIGRETSVACEIGGHALPAGANVYMLPWVVQRDPRFFDAPEEFRPERWLDGLRERLPRFAYFPFGGGPRLCIGQSFAMLEAQLVLSSIARAWVLDLIPGHPVVPQPTLTVRPKYGLRMQLRRR
jgi:cytochrome P450